MWEIKNVEIIPTVFVASREWHDNYNWVEKKGVTKT